MLFNFPAPYPDELLYSVIARYHVRSGNKSFFQTAADVFNNGETHISYDLPTNMNIFIDNLPPQWDMTADDWIYHHTLYPFYAPFTPIERAKRLYHTMLEYKESQHALVSATNGFILLPKFLRYCPLCKEESMNQNGETYWKRTHQAPGVLVCPWHHIKLLDSTISTEGRSRHLFHADEENCPSHAQERFPEDIHPLMVKLAKQIERIIRSKLEPKPKEWFETAYFYLLSEKNLVTLNNQVNLSELSKRMNHFYSNEVLGLLECEIHYRAKKSFWLSHLLKKSLSGNHPVRHLLLIHFLGYSFERFLTVEIPEQFNQPFGDGPWLCFNPVCEFYQQAVIQEFRKVQNAARSRIYGQFECTCGFIYNRRGPDVSEADRFRYTSIIAYGHVWENELKEKAKHMSLTRLSEKFGVSPTFIKKKLNEFGLTWTKGLQQGRKKKRVIVKDWEKKDEEILEKIKRVALDLSTFSDTRPVRIYRETLCDAIGEKRLFRNHLHLLPKTKEYIQTLVDDKRSYNIKCVRWAAQYLKSHGHVVTKAAIRSLSMCKDYSEEMQREIEWLMEKE